MDSGALPRPPGFNAWVSERQYAVKKKTVPKHCLPEIRHGAHVAPRHCTILHDGKGHDQTIVLSFTACLTVSALISVSPILLPMTMAELQNLLIILAVPSAALRIASRADSSKMV